MQFNNQKVNNCKVFTYEELAKLKNLLSFLINPSDLQTDFELPLAVSNINKKPEKCN